MPAKLPKEHQLKIQAASYETARNWQERERDSQHGVWCKLGMGSGALIFLGGVLTLK